MNPPWNGSKRRNGGLWNNPRSESHWNLVGDLEWAAHARKASNMLQQKEFHMEKRSEISSNVSSQRTLMQISCNTWFLLMSRRRISKTNWRKIFLNNSLCFRKNFFKSQQFALDVLHHHINRSSDGIPKKGTYLMQRMPQSEKEMTTKQPIKISLIFVVWCSGLSQPLYFWTS